MAALVNWFIATVTGSVDPITGSTTSPTCYLIGGAYLEVFATMADLDGMTMPAVKQGIRKVWVGSGTGDLKTLDAIDLSIVRTVSFGGNVSYVGCHGPNLIVSMQDGRLFAIDVQTEQIRWSRQFARNVSYAVETTDVLLVLADLVFALDAYSGAILWQVSLAYVFNVSADNGVFYLTHDLNILEARRARDGSVIWDRTEPNYNYSGVTAVGDAVYATTEGSKVYSLSAASGAVIWSTEGQGFAGSPLCRKDLVIMPVSHSGPHIPGLAAYAIATGSQSWITGPLPGSSGGDYPIYPPMRYFTGLIGFQLSQILYIVDDTGQIHSQLGVSGELVGVAYLYGEIGGWPKP
jgi:outer membrane protein assembly factor BamB